MNQISFVQLQLDFLNQIQGRLLESKVQTSYKYALLHALADLSVRYAPHDPQESVTLSVNQIAEAWYLIYQRQTKPYPSKGSNISYKKLSQSHTSGKSILDLIDEHLIEQSSKQALLKKLTKRLKNPIERLYSGESAHNNFLYSYQGDTLTLKPYIAFCFREHYSLVVSLIRERWITFIRQINGPQLGEHIELSDFLFGVERSSLAKHYQLISQTYEKKCFYCRIDESALQEGSNSLKLAVDHFIPWSKYPVDLAHNFVFACPSCNSSKSDHLASLEHVSRWIELLQKKGALLSEASQKLNLSHDINASLMIASWVYRRHLKLGGELWLTSKRFQHEELQTFEALFFTKNV